MLNKAADLSHLSPGMVYSQRALLGAIKTVFRVDNEDFQKLLKMYDLQGDGDLSESFGLFIHDPL